MRFLFVIASLLIIQTSFGQSKKQLILPPQVLSMSYPDFVNACELLTYKKKLVYTRFIYSGIEEYWGLSAEKKCNKEVPINAFLDIPDNLQIQPKHQKLLQDVHNNYWKKFLIIDAVGIFNEGKYGHLGTNNSVFTVSKIIDIYIIDKKLPADKNR